MTIEPQINVPLSSSGVMTVETYAMLKSFYDAITDTNAITLKSPNGTLYEVTVSDAGALVVTAA